MFEYPLLLSVGSPEGSIFLSECDTFGFGARRRVSNGAAGDLCPPEGITSRLTTSQLSFTITNLIARLWVLTHETVGALAAS